MYLCIYGIIFKKCLREEGHCSKVVILKEIRWQIKNLTNSDCVKRKT